MCGHVTCGLTFPFLFHLVSFHFLYSFLYICCCPMLRLLSLWGMWLDSPSWLPTTKGSLCAIKISILKIWNLTIPKHFCSKPFMQLDVKFGLQLWSFFFKQFETLNTPKHDEIEAQYDTVWFCVVNRQVNSCIHPIQGRFVPLLLVSPWCHEEAETVSRNRKGACQSMVQWRTRPWRWEMAFKRSLAFLCLTFESESSASATSIV